MEQSLFSGRDLRRMILPLFFEQLLGMTVGLADTAIISFAGKAALPRRPVEEFPGACGFCKKITLANPDKLCYHILA